MTLEKLSLKQILRAAPVGSVSIATALVNSTAGLLSLPWCALAQREYNRSFILKDDGRLAPILHNVSINQ